MSTRKVLIVSNHARIVGGGEISMLTLVRGLSQTEWQPLVAVPGPGEVADRCDELGVPVYESPLPTMRRPGTAMLDAARTARRLIHDTDPAIVHAHGSRAMFYAGLGSRRRVPVVWHLRVALPDPLLDAVLVRLATAPIAVSHTVRRRLHPWPSAFDACRVIANGLDLDRFVATRERREVRRELGVGDDELVVSCVSRLVDGKCHTLLLDACAALRDGPVATRWVIVGDGPERDRLRRYAREIGVDDRVVFTGDRDDIADLLDAADAFALPAANEGFGRVVIEAMARGLPVVVADSGGPAEIIEDGRTGLLFASGDRMSLVDRLALLLGNPALRRRLGTAARREAFRAYTMQVHTHRVVELYETLAKGT